MIFYCPTTKDFMQAKMPVPATVLAEIRAAKCRTIATYTSYAEAQNALDYLIDHGFHEQSLAIVLQEVTPHQTVPQGSNWVFSSGQTALNGAVVGLGISFLALMVSMLTPTYQASVDLAFSGVVYGALVGAVMGILTWVFAQKNTAKNVAQCLALEQYNVIAQSTDATRAEQVLFSLIEPAI
jgi:hypothetical protein